MQLHFQPDGDDCRGVIKSLTARKVGTAEARIAYENRLAVGGRFGTRASLSLIGTRVRDVCTAKEPRNRSSRLDTRQTSDTKHSLMSGKIDNTDIQT